MARIKGAMMTRKRRNKILKLAKGYWGSKSTHFKMASYLIAIARKNAIRIDNSSRKNVLL